MVTFSRFVVLSVSLTWKLYCSPWHLGDYADKKLGAQFALGAFGCCLPNLDATLMNIGRQVVANQQSRLKIIVVAEQV